MANKNPVISNRKAYRDFHIIKTLEAGIKLMGNEVKSLRAGRGNLKGSFARVEKDQVFLYNMHISPYKYSREDYDPFRSRKLLLHRSEIRQLIADTSQKGYTLVPLKVYFRRGYAKVKLAVAKGKRMYDKRQALKEKQAKREMDRAVQRRRKGY